MRLRKAAAAIVLSGAFLPTLAPAQTTPVWNRVAGYTVNLAGLAAPATGPVQSVWYSAGGARLLALTESRKVFETTDFQHWRLNSDETVPVRSVKPGPAAVPEGGVKVATSGTRIYSVTRDNIYGSDDGRLWVNLTGFNGVSIIGDGFSELAVSPSNPLDISAANKEGVWRSLDGGLSWQGLNEDLPNLDARSLAGQRTVVLANAAQASVTAGKWALVDGVSRDAMLRAALLARNGIAATAAEQTGGVTYAGTATGDMWIVAEGAAPVHSSISDAGKIDRIWIDPGNSQAALAASGAKLYRTTSGGKFWDDVTGALSAGAIHGITADSVAGVVYLATDNGIISGRLSLNAADQVPTKWNPVNANLPIAAALDVRLNMDGTLTVLLDGWGVWETPAPHRAVAPRIVNGADMSDRAAAPGSLITVIGVNVKQATSGRNAYPVLLPSDQSSQLQVPFEVTPGRLQLAVQSDGGGFFTAPLNVKEAAPAIFVNADGEPMILDADSQLVIDPGTPLRAGSTIQVLATGLGRVTPEWPTGVPAPVDSPPAVVAPVTAFLNGTPIRVTRATLAPTLVGNYLVELEIPAIVNRGVTELRIVVNGEESNRVKLFLEPGFTVQ